jgi:aminoglycoside phosphotransferase (APT) family kinase protein
MTVGTAAFPDVGRDLVDPDRLRSWMDSRGLGRGPLTEAALLAGGTQNVLVRFRRGDRAYVLRRPPRHKRANSDETIRREAVLLAGLAGSGVPHPGLVAVCADLDVLGAAFLLTEYVEGVNPCTGPPLAPPAAHTLGLGLVDALAALGRVDPAAGGLAGLGRPQGWLDRQVARWRRQRESYTALPPDSLPAADRLEAWLEAHRPREWRPGVVHGDFHAANVLVGPAGGIAAVVDWELATIGDPLLDLGHLLATWPDPVHGPTPATVLALPGLPTRDELVARYASVADRPVAAVEWYRALACHRLAVLLEGTHARAVEGLAPRETGDRLHARAVALVEQGLAVVDTDTRRNSP